RSENNLTKGVHQFNLTELKSGIYFVRIFNNNEISVERFIKQ
ncbi:MAG: T9SS type A sorting domain-containing protein, partial [Vicingaceae bacterium]